MSGRTRAAVEQLQRTAERVARVAEQTRVEFGYKAQVVDNEDGVVLEDRRPDRVNPGNQGHRPSAPDHSPDPASSLGR